MQTAITAGQKYYDKSGKDYTATATQDVGGGNKGQFLSSDYSLTKPPSVTTPTVLSADKAKEDATKQSQTASDLIKQAADQAATNKATADANAVAKTAKEQADQAAQLEKDKLASQDALAGVTKGEDVAGITQKKIEEQRTQAYQDIVDASNNWKNGTFPLTEADMANISALQQKYDKMIKQQKDINDQYEGAVTSVGVSSGRSRYAPELEQNNIKAAVQQGTDKINELNVAAATAVAQLKQAIQDKNYQAVIDLNKQTNDYLNQKSETIASVNKAVSDEADKIAQQQQQALQNQQLELNIQKVNQEILTKHAETLSGALLTVDEIGNVSMPTSEEIQSLSDSTGISVVDLISSLNKQSSAVSKLSAEDRKTELEIKKAQKDLLLQGLSDDEKEMNNAKARGEFPQNGTILDWKKAVTSAESKAIVTDGMTAYQISTFNSIVSKYNASPLISASDRTIVLKNTIEQIKNDPSNAALQLNLVYSYVQALDTYQSAVREGELSLVNSVDSKFGQVKSEIEKIQNGQIVRADVAKKIADAANSLVTTIDDAAKRKAESFKSQASVSGIGDAWDKYISGFEQGYNKEKPALSFDEFFENSNNKPKIEKMLQDTQLGATIEERRNNIMEFFNSEKSGASLSFNQPVRSGVNSSIVNKVVNVPDGSKGGTTGQCGSFVYAETGIRVPDDYKGKLALMDKSIKTPEPGMVFVMPTKTENGHIGIILSVNNGVATVKDSNWDLNGKVKTHTIPVSKMTGFKNVG